MALLLGLHSRMFSGFRSQWMMLSSGVARNSSAVHNCWANFRVRFKETPLKFVFRNKSYRLYDNISNTKQRWFRNMKCRFKCTEKRNTFRFLFKIEGMHCMQRFWNDIKELNRLLTYIVFHLCVMFVHELEKPYFNLSLIQKGLLVLDNLNCYPLLLSSVVSFYNLKKCQ